MEDAPTAPILQNLGLKTFVNGFETLTRYGGSSIRKKSVEAMAEIGPWFVDLIELNRAAGKRIAELTRNEAAFVTSGCAAALALTAAACALSRGFIPEGDLPFGRFGSQRPKIVVHRGQRNPYDQALLLPGTEVAEFGYPTHVATSEQLQKAVDDHTAAVFFFAGKIFERYALPLREVVRIAHAASVPVVVDAAAQVPPRSNLWKFTDEGADLALFSGGKGIRGPQDTGLVVGRRDLIEQVETIASPNHGFGRAMKTSKEAIVGLLSAVEEMMEEDEEGIYRAAYARAERLQGLLQGLLQELPGVAVEILPTGRHGQKYPRVRVTLNEAEGLNRESIIDDLARSDPAVLAGPLDEDPTSLYFNVFAVTDEEVPIITKGLRAVLGNRGRDNELKGEYR